MRLRYYLQNKMWTNGSQLFLCFALIAFMACNDDIYNGPTNPKLPEIDQFFSYSTEKEIELNIQYESPNGSKVRFEIFTEDPLVEYSYTVEDAENGSVVITDYRKGIHSNPIAGGFTNTNGKYSGKVIAPASVKELFLLSDNVGVPQLYKIPANSGNFTIDFKNAITRSDAYQSILDERTTIIDNYELKGPWNGPNNLQTIYFNENGSDYWYTNGAPTWSEIKTLTPNILDAAKALRTNTKISAANEAGKTVHYYSKSADFLKRHLLKTDFEVANNGEVEIQVISTYCSMHNSLAYYIYEAEETPTTLDELNKLERYLILPLARAQDGMGGWKPLVSPVGESTNSESVKLINPKNPENPYQFTKGTKIGFVLLPSSYEKRNPAIPQIIYDNNPNYSTAIADENFISFPEDPTEQNLFGFKINSNKPCQTVASIKVAGMDYYEVFGFEDQKSISYTDTDFDDLIFGVSNIKGTENTADPEPIITTKNGLLLFEDNWPLVGDYDMNDVVVEYRINHSINDNNNLTESTYEFKIIWGGATYRNSFAILLPNEVSTIEDLGTEDGYLILANTDMGASNGRYVSVCENINDYYDMTGPISDITPNYHFKAVYKENTSADAANEFNPFIVARYPGSNVEVHLIGKTPTSLMLQDDEANALFDTQNDSSYKEQSDGKTYWYAGANYLPFALNLTDTDGDIFALDFYKLNEKLGIHTVFAKFTPWANRVPGYEDVKWWE